MHPFEMRVAPFGAEAFIWREQ
jgi:hypothetical protein